MALSGMGFLRRSLCLAILGNAVLKRAFNLRLRSATKPRRGEISCGGNVGQRSDSIYEAGTNGIRLQGCIARDL